MRPNFGRRIAVRTAAVVGIVVFGQLAVACVDKPKPEAKAQLEQFEADPVAKFRAPGTKFFGDSKQEGIVRFNNEETDTRLDQVFSMTGDPADTVDAYHSVAEAAGWALTFEGCSRFQQATGRAYSRTVEGTPASLSIRAELGTAPESGPGKDTLWVSFGGDDSNVNVGLRRKDLGCLTGLDPSGPEMVQPKTDRVTPEALCAAVSLDGLPVQDRYPYGEPDDGEPSSCSFNGGVGVGALFSVGEVGFPLAFYQDRSAEDAAPGQRFSFGGDESAGIWLMGRHGPLVVTSRYSPLGQFEMSPERLQRIADDLAAL
jgi:hypothetical protein